MDFLTVGIFQLSNGKDHGGRGEELAFKPDCAEPSRASHSSRAIRIAERSTTHNEPQDSTTATQQQAFANTESTEDAEIPTASSAHRQFSVGWPSRRKTSAEMENCRRREDVPISHFLDARRQRTDRLRRTDIVANIIIHDATHEPKGNGLVGDTMSRRDRSRPQTLIEGSGFIAETIHQQSHFSTQDIDQSERPLSQ